MGKRDRLMQEGERRKKKRRWMNAGRKEGETRKGGE